MARKKSKKEELHEEEYDLEEDDFEEEEFEDDEEFDGDDEADTDSENEDEASEDDEDDDEGEITAEDVMKMKKSTLLELADDYELDIPKGMKLKELREFIIEELFEEDDSVDPDDEEIEDTDIDDTEDDDSEEDDEETVELDPEDIMKMKKSELLELADDYELDIPKGMKLKKLREFLIEELFEDEEEDSEDLEDSEAETEDQGEADESEDSGDDSEEEDDEEDSEDPTPEDVMKMKKADLLELADEFGVKIPKGMKLKKLREFLIEELFEEEDSEEEDSEEESGEGYSEDDEYLDKNQTDDEEGSEEQKQTGAKDHVEAQYQDSDTYRLLRLLSGVYLGGEIKECLLGSTGKKMICTAMDLSSSVFVSAAIPFKFPVGEYGIGDIYLLIKYLKSVLSDNVTFDLDGNRFICSKKGGGSISYLLSDTDLISTFSEDWQDEDPTEEAEELLNDYKYTLPLTVGALSEFYSLVKLFNPDFVKVVIEKGKVYFTCGSDTEHQFKVLMGEVKSKVSLSTVIHTRSIREIIPLLEEEQSVTMYLDDNASVGIKTDTFTWLISNVIEGEEDD